MGLERKEGEMKERIDVKDGGIMKRKGRQSRRETKQEERDHMDEDEAEAGKKVRTRKQTMEGATNNDTTINTFEMRSRAEAHSNTYDHTREHIRISISNWEKMFVLIFICAEQ